MSEQPDKYESAEFDQASDELTRALKLCHSLIDDYRSKLASNLNDINVFQAANDDGEEDDSRLG